MREQGAAFKRHLNTCRRTEDECWIWPVASGQGWPKTLWKGKLRQASRAVYEELVGPIPDGLELDHICKVRACVNPAHLEPVPQYTNLMRSDGLGARNARKTHCPKGHAYASYHEPGTPRPRRVCRECHRALWRRSYRHRGKPPRASHCKRGHSLADAWVDKQGKRTCRECRRLRLLGRLVPQ